AGRKREFAIGRNGRKPGTPGMPTSTMAEATGAEEPSGPMRIVEMTRRGLVKGVLAGAAGAVAGAFAFSGRGELEPRTGESHSDEAAPVEVTNGGAKAEPDDPFRERMEESFRVEARRIHELHRQQTVATVAGLKLKYEQPVFGRMRVWDLVEKLALCI